MLKIHRNKMVIQVLHLKMEIFVFFKWAVKYIVFEYA